ncbi:DUF2817 domain-containing protein [Flavobacteriaceae sp. LMIT009]
MGIDYSVIKEQKLFHRYINNDHIEPLLANLSDEFIIDKIGYSVKNNPIYGVKIGTGSKKVLLWSQMHGNESTTTKAIFDIFNYFNNEKSILNKCTLFFIPILNPDGAKVYTRVNANNVDLNRDAQNLSQPESKVLRDVFNDFKPDFCFNLHGQRTIFSAGSTNNSAILSFLSPAQDEKCSITNNRKEAMEIIVVINKMLQKIIPNQVGVYDDTFNINCVGDTFQSFNVPTILFEAGHFPNDYAREETRRLIFLSLLEALMVISTNNNLGKNYAPYLDIPENEKLFFDIIIREASLNTGSKESIIDLAIHYEEVLVNDRIEFIPKIKKIGNLSNYHAHREINANKNELLLPDGVTLNVENSIDFVTIANNKYLLNLK